MTAVAQIQNSSFSQQEYDESFVLAFALNTEFGRASIDYKPEFWSMQKGFDDGLKAFKKLYEIKNYNPVNYDVSSHIHEIVSRVEEDDSVLTSSQKQELLKALTRIVQRSRPPDNE